MSAKTQAPGERKTRRAITKLLKTEGPIDSAQLAERLGLTAMAVRLHLYALQSEGLVTAEERPVPIGRPAKHWRLTREADRFFPEAYAELSVALVDAMRDTFGDDGRGRFVPVAAGGGDDVVLVHAVAADADAADQLAVLVERDAARKDLDAVRDVRYRGAGHVRPAQG